MYCSACGDERVFERPPCPDGHGADCPEWICTDCGAAVLVDQGPVRAASSPRPSLPTTPASGRTAARRPLA
ncbi:hypothetical protein GCM10009678_63720 [Actinomadura kijaniata]|uniref:Uncharacterized protein n=1 Tax=Actinomadura namibiensis TaxID=182080 RepID=A0A7W3QM33_ACTNM|nr:MULTISPECIES: hypothetical protein [Actinomadura]MBA8952139.1 hypothetical protein [Actinomadura namibiensis]